MAKSNKPIINKSQYEILFKSLLLEECKARYKDLEMPAEMMKDAEKDVIKEITGLDGKQINGVISKVIHSMQAIEKEIGGIEEMSGEKKQIYYQMVKRAVSNLVSRHEQAMSAERVNRIKNYSKEQIKSLKSHIYQEIMKKFEILMVIPNTFSKNEILQKIDTKVNTLTSEEMNSYIFDHNKRPVLHSLIAEEVVEKLKNIDFVRKEEIKLKLRNKEDTETMKTNLKLSNDQIKFRKNQEEKINKEKSNLAQEMLHSFENMCLAKAQENNLTVTSINDAIKRVTNKSATEAKAEIEDYVKYGVRISFDKKSQKYVLSNTDHFLQNLLGNDSGKKDITTKYFEKHFHEIGYDRLDEVLSLQETSPGDISLAENFVGSYCTFLKSKAGQEKLSNGLTVKQDGILNLMKFYSSEKQVVYPYPVDDLIQNFILESIGNKTLHKQLENWLRDEEKNEIVNDMLYLSSHPELNVKDLQKVREKLQKSSKDLNKAGKKEFKKYNHGLDLDKLNEIFSPFKENRLLNESATGKKFNAIYEIVKNLTSLDNEIEKSIKHPRQEIVPVVSSPAEQYKLTSKINEIKQFFEQLIKKIQSSNGEDSKKFKDTIQEVKYVSFKDSITKLIEEIGLLDKTKGVKEALNNIYQIIPLFKKIFAQTSSQPKAIPLSHNEVQGAETNPVVVRMENYVIFDELDLITPIAPVDDIPSVKNNKQNIQSLDYKSQIGHVINQLYNRLPNLKDMFNMPKKDVKKVIDVTDLSTFRDGLSTRSNNKKQNNGPEI